MNLDDHDKIPCSYLEYIEWEGPSAWLEDKEGKGYYFKLVPKKKTVCPGCGPTVIEFTGSWKEMPKLETCADCLAKKPEQQCADCRSPVKDDQYYCDVCLDWNVKRYGKVKPERGCQTCSGCGFLFLVKYLVGGLCPSCAPKPDRFRTVDRLIDGLTENECMRIKLGQLSRAIVKLIEETK